MTISYSPGKKNQNADGLSRQAWEGMIDKCKDDRHHQ